MAVNSTTAPAALTNLRADLRPYQRDGVAWLQHTGVSAVEVRVDDGPWQPATLATAISADTWVQWRYEWDAPPGRHTIRVRAISADGEVQTAERAPVAPDGATGHHERTFDVR